MSFIFAIIAIPWLSATGIYNPQVVDRHGHCLAEPGSFHALYCSGAKQTTPPPRGGYRYRM
jgi:hypothetical protein